MAFLLVVYSPAGRVVFLPVSLTRVWGKVVNCVALCIHVSASRQEKKPSWLSAESQAPTSRFHPDGACVRVCVCVCARCTCVRVSLQPQTRSSQVPAFVLPLSCDRDDSCESSVAPLGDLRLYYLHACLLPGCPLLILSGRASRSRCPR